jgi:diacylglycerol kinase family enzyme
MLVNYLEVIMMNLTLVRQILKIVKNNLTIGNYNFFWVCNIPWPDSNLKIAPLSKPDDGFCDVITMRSDRGGRISQTRMLIQDSGYYFDKNGNHRPSSGVEYRKTKYWRFTPKTSLHGDVISDVESSRKFYSIDGEKYPAEPISVKVIPSCLRFFCINKSN